MSTEKQCEQGGFQELQEEVLTYALSQQIPPSPKNKPRRVHRAKNQRHRLELLPLEINAPMQLDLKEINKQIKRMESGKGKVIPLGNATFRSNFQCGNLANVQMVAANTYTITLQRETNSNRGSAWFYFSVEGLRGEAHFIIRGFTKSSSLYSEGMKVCYRDVKQLTKWRRGGSRIVYTNSVGENDEYEAFYQLRFSHFFRNNQHTCIEFAYCFPYGLKKLYSMIAHIKQQATCSCLAKSFNGLDIPLLTLGNPQSKQVIVLSARVHPGQTVSSFIMEGFLRELVGDNQFGRMLRGKYLIKVVPMLNPDGVTAGNYRFSGFGCDLNRKWRSCKENQQPEIYYMRELIRNLNRERKVIMYIDMHGHSRKKHVFFYGCCEKGQDVSATARPKQFPFLMEKLHDAYKYENCCFNVQKDKEGTARVTVWKDLKIDYVYTLQSTFCGPDFGPNYLQADYERIGRKLCEGIAIFFYSSQPEKHVHEYRAIQKLSGMKEKAFNELLDNPTLLQIGDEDDSGSQSEPQIGEIPEKQRFPESGLPRPDSLRQAKLSPSKPKKLTISKKFFSQSSISEKRNQKLKSEVSAIALQNNAEKIDLVEQALPQQSIKISHNRIDKVQIKIANTLTTFELESLRASSLYQKNVRVHSLTRPPQKPTARSRRIVNPFSEQPSPNDQRIRVNLMHGRQGVQYRRVRKLAQQNLKKDLLVQQDVKVVKQLTGNQFYMGQTQRSNANSITATSIASRLEFSSQQRHRKASADALRRGNDFKKISINGDEFSVRCRGLHNIITASCTPNASSPNNPERKSRNLTSITRAQNNYGPFPKNNASIQSNHNVPMPSTPKAPPHSPIKKYPSPQAYAEYSLKPPTPRFPGLTLSTARKMAVIKGLFLARADRYHSHHPEMCNKLLHSPRPIASTRTIIENPGPSDYNKEQIKKNSKGFTMRPKTPNGRNYFIQDKEKKEVPGPNEYNPVLFQGGKCSNSRLRSTILGWAGLMRRSPRFEENPNANIPGPSTYDTTSVSMKSKSTGGCIGNALRRSFIDNIRKKDLSPGPGNYQLPSQFGRPARYSDSSSKLHAHS